jgi:hypothetical protein
MTWIPPSGRDELSGCMWMPRLLAKARRYAASPDAMGEYMFGDHDFLDAKLLRFLNANGEAICGLVRSEPDDGIVATRLLAASGRSPQDVVHWNRRFVRFNGPFLLMIDADEGRAHGALAQSLSFVYNRLIVPPATALFRRAARRAGPTSGSP